MPNTLKNHRKSMAAMMALSAAVVLVSGCQRFSATQGATDGMPGSYDQAVAVSEALDEQPVLYPARFSIRVHSGGSGALLPADLDKQLQPLLATVGGWRQVTRVMVVGHTDAEGSEKSNLLLSIRRAHAVADKLVDFGMPEGALEVDGRGEAVPIASNDSISGKKLNRRIEIIAEGLVEQGGVQRVGSRD